MRCFWKKTGFALLTAILCGSTAAFAQKPAVTPIPTVVGPIPVTADSYPFMAANRTQAPVDLAKLGYVEEEFFVSGTANVYDWPAPGELRVKTANAPYATRILVRRPADPARFSGNVMVEALNTSRRYDWAFMWAIMHPHVTEHRDAWVGVTQPENIDFLRKFDPLRYTALSFTNPNPDERCGPKSTTSTFEVGLKWDAFSQIGALLKSDLPSKPLAGFKVQYLYMTSHGSEVMAYANAVHNHVSLADGKPVYDGYLNDIEENPAKINRCAAPGRDLLAGDPRQIVENVNVPVIRVIAQGDLRHQNTVNNRRPDSDAPGDRFRLYEVAAAPHMEATYYRHLPVPEDQVKGGAQRSLANWPLPYACDPPITFLDFPILRYLLNGAYANLDRWVRTGTPPPRAERMAVTMAPGAKEATVEVDEFGNGKGGVRTPYVDVPIATYLPNSPGRGICRNLGRAIPFDWARLEQLYGSPKAYAAKVAEAVDRLVNERWITESDGKKMTEELSAPLSAPREVLR